MAPSVDRDRQRPDNCEYPWEDGRGRLHVPIRHTFPVGQLRIKPHGRAVLKWISEAIDKMAS